MSPAVPDGIVVAAPDQADIEELCGYLEQLSDVELAVVQRSPGPGELGAAQVLTVIAGSGGLIAAVRTLPKIIRSRRVGFRIETTVRGERFVLDATNVDELMPVLEKLLEND